jgi:hypothetical protein
VAPWDRADTSKAASLWKATRRRSPLSSLCPSTRTARAGSRARRDRVLRSRLEGARLEAREILEVVHEGHDLAGPAGERRQRAPVARGHVRVGGEGGGEGAGRVRLRLGPEQGQQLMLESRFTSEHPTPHARGIDPADDERVTAA